MMPGPVRMRGTPHRWPSPDPSAQHLQTIAAAAEQPYIHRLTYLGVGVEARRRGRSIAFASEVSSLLYGGTRDWHLGEHLQQSTGAGPPSRHGRALLRPGSHRLAVLAAGSRQPAQDGLARVG